jgi:hypothetical protein
MSLPTKSLEFNFYNMIGVISQANKPSRVLITLGCIVL